MAPLHALLMILKDVNGEAVCPVHRRDALWLLIDSLFMFSELLFHCKRC